MTENAAARQPAPEYPILTVGAAGAVCVDGRPVDPAAVDPAGVFSWGGGKALAAAAANAPDDDTREAVRRLAAGHTDALINFVADTGFPVPAPAKDLAQMFASAFAYGYIDRLTTTGKTSRWILPGAATVGPRLRPTADAYAAWLADPPSIAWMRDNGTTAAAIVADYNWIADAKTANTATAGGLLD